MIYRRIGAIQENNRHRDYRRYAYSRAI